MKPITIGLLVGNRGFFPAQLCETGRKIMLDVLEKAGFKVVSLGAKATRFGSGEGAPVMDYQEILAGTVVGRVAAAPFTYLRVSTDAAAGKIRAYIGQGELTNDPLKTFGGYGVVRIPNFQKLLAHICENGYEHHVAVNPTHIGTGVKEAMTKYLDWEVYQHE